MVTRVTKYKTKNRSFFCLPFFFFYAHYFVSGKCHVVHSPNPSVEASTHQTTTRRGGEGTTSDIFKLFLQQPKGTKTLFENRIKREKGREHCYICFVFPTPHVPSPQPPPPPAVHFRSFKCFFFLFFFFFPFPFLDSRRDDVPSNSKDSHPSYFPPP